MIERLTDYFGEKYICIKGCKSLYENAERKSHHLENRLENEYAVQLPGG